jgi:chemotaxis protein MotB
MGKKDWEKMASADDISGLGVSPHRGRGWKVFSLLLLVGSATFVVAYYVPLYRAHQQLRDEYKKTSAEASTFRRQLTDTVATLSSTTNVCDKMRSDVRKKTEDTDALASALASRTEHIERSLQIPLKKFKGRGKLSVAREKDLLRVTLAAPAVVAPTSGDLSTFGKMALCALGGSLKDSDVHVVVQGLGFSPAGKPSASWQLATTRAGNAAQFLSEKCGVDASRIEVAVSASPASSDGSTMAIEITPRTDAS